VHAATNVHLSSVAPAPSAMIPTGDPPYISHMAGLVVPTSAVR